MKLFVFPGNLEPAILEAGAHEVPYARTPEFGALVTRCHHRLAALAGAADGTTLSFTASGTGAVEALLANWGPRWPRLLVLQAGTFGDRWFDMAVRLGLPVESVEWAPHDEPPWPAIEAAIASGRHHAVLAVHHETSTGEIVDLARLGSLCHQAGTRLLVDAIGSFLADPFDMVAWHVDAAVISSQKGLCLPPGLAFLITRPSLGPPADRPLSFYFDARCHLESVLRGQPPWSPAAQLYIQLDRRLDSLDPAPLAGEERARVGAKAAAFRDRLARTRGWSGAARHPSICLTALRFNAPAIALVHALAAESCFILPSPDPSLVRIAHLGHTSVDDHLDLADRLTTHADTLGLAPAAAAPP